MKTIYIPSATAPSTRLTSRRLEPDFIKENRPPSAPELVDEVAYLKREIIIERKHKRVTFNFGQQDSSDDEASGLRSPKQLFFAADATEMQTASTAVESSPEKSKVLELLTAIQEQLERRPEEYLSSLEQLNEHYRELSSIMATGWQDMREMVKAASFLIVGIRRIKEHLEQTQAPAAPVQIETEAEPEPCQFWFQQLFTRMRCSLG